MTKKETLQKIGKGMVKAGKATIKGFQKVQEGARKFQKETGFGQNPNWIWGDTDIPGHSTVKRKGKVDLEGFEVETVTFKKRRKE